MQVQVIRKNDNRINRILKTRFITRLRVAAYCRVSTGDEDQKNSYESQVKYYTQKINENEEWEYVEVYADEAITGTQTKKRNDFMRMIGDCMAGKIDIILTKSISRFARNTVDTLNYVRMLKEKNIAVIFEEENINTLEMSGELLLTILSSVAQQESETTSLHVKQGIKMKRERGEVVGFTRCLGLKYDSVLKKIVIIEADGEAETIRYIFNRYRAGVGGKSIARELTAMGAKTLNGSTVWYDSTVLGIIKNEKYKGDMLMGKTFTLDPISHKRVINMGEEDMYYIENHHPAIIPREEFDEAQEILQSRTVNNTTKGRRKGNYSRKYPFSSRLYCGFCGTILVRKTLYSSRKEAKKTWQCMNYVKVSKDKCPYCKAIKEEIVEKCFVDMYNVMYKNNTKVLETFFDDVVSTLKESSPEKELKRIENKKEEIKRQLDKILSLLIEGTIEEKDFKEKKSQYLSKLEKIETEEKHLKNNQYDEKKLKNGVEKIKEVFANQQLLKNFDESIFEALVSRVIIGNDDENGINPYAITFLLKSNYDNIGKPRNEICNNPVLMEFISFQTFASFEIGKNFSLEKTFNDKIKVKVKFDI